MVKNMKVGIIGCGKIAEKHINAYKKMKDVEIFIHDIDASKKQVAKLHGINWLNKDKDITNDPSINVIDICLPTSHHYEFIMRALKSGKDVFCEKPLTDSLNEALEIKKAASRLNRLVMVGYLYRFHPAFKMLKEVFDDKILGRPYHAIFRLGGRGSHSAWKHQKNKGGGATNEILVHMLDLMLWYFKDVYKIKVLQKKVISEKRRIGNKTVKADADDYIIMKADANKTKIICHCDLVSPSYMNYIEVHGEDGSAWTSILDFFPTVVYCNNERGIYDKGHNFFNFQKTDLFYEELKFFLEASSEGEKNTESIDQSIKMLRLLKDAKLIK